MSAHAAVTAVAGWEKSLLEAWPLEADDVDGAWVVGAIDEDENKYPVITVEADQYDWPGESEKIARALIVLWAKAFSAHPEQAELVAPTLNEQEREDLLEFHQAVCCDAGHRVDKSGMRRLAEIGAVVSAGFGKHRLTEFGTYLLAALSAQGGEA